MANVDLSSREFHTAIIGGGASGLFCAGSFTHDKIVLEANEKPALKVAASGGGKCNFTNRFVSAADYESRHPHFCKSALAAFKPADFISVLEKDSVAWQERENGCLFAQTASDIVRFLLRRARAQRTQLACGVRVLDVAREQNQFHLFTSAGSVYARHVVLACGGLSYPGLGANAFGWTLARRLGLTVVEPRPVLCGLTLPRELRERFKVLAGNSIPVQIKVGKKVFSAPLLFTHEGFSGPAVLQASLYWQPGQTVEIDFLPGQQALELFQAHKNSSHSFVSALEGYIPGKIARVLLGSLQRDLSNATRAHTLACAQAVNQFRFVPGGTSGYTKAEATAGGVDTQELDSHTMACRRVPGVYIIGELIDVTGRVGGFNLQWAWSSAFVAAQALEKKY